MDDGWMKLGSSKLCWRKTGLVKKLSEKLSQARSHVALFSFSINMWASFFLPSISSYIPKTDINDFCFLRNQ